MRISMLLAVLLLTGCVTQYPHYGDYDDAYVERYRIDTVYDDGLYGYAGAGYGHSTLDYFYEPFWYLGSDVGFFYSYRPSYYGSVSYWPYYTDYYWHYPVHYGHRPVYWPYDRYGYHLTHHHYGYHGRHDDDRHDGNHRHLDRRNRHHDGDRRDGNRHHAVRSASDEVRRITRSGARYDRPLRGDRTSRARLTPPKSEAAISRGGESPRIRSQRPDSRAWGQPRSRTESATRVHRGTQRTAAPSPGQRPVTRSGPSSRDFRPVRTRPTASQTRRPAPSARPSPAREATASSGAVRSLRSTGSQGSRPVTVRSRGGSRSTVVPPSSRRPEAPARSRSSSAIPRSRPAPPPRPSNDPGPARGRDADRGHRRDDGRGSKPRSRRGRDGKD